MEERVKDFITLNGVFKVTTKHSSENIIEECFIMIDSYPIISDAKRYVKENTTETERFVIITTTHYR